MLIAPVVNLHRYHHGRDSPGRPSHLTQQKIVAGSVAFFRHDRGSAEYNHQSNKYQDQGDRKQPAIDTNALCHGRFISPRSSKGAEKNVCESPGEAVTILVHVWGGPSGPPLLTLNLRCAGTSLPPWIIPHRRSQNMNELDHQSQK